jgi:hypothetical protein
MRWFIPVLLGLVVFAGPSAADNPRGTAANIPYGSWMRSTKAFTVTLHLQAERMQIELVAKHGKKFDPKLTIHADYGVTRDNILFAIVTSTEGPENSTLAKEVLSVLRLDETFRFRFRVDDCALTVKEVKFARGEDTLLQGRYQMIYSAAPYGPPPPAPPGVIVPVQPTCAPPAPCPAPTTCTSATRMPHEGITPPVTVVHETATPDGMAQWQRNFGPVEQKMVESNVRTPILPALRAGEPVPAPPPPTLEDVVMQRPEIAAKIVLSCKRDQVQMMAEQLTDWIDPPRIYPMIGPAQMRHVHWKCILYYPQPEQENGRTFLRYRSGETVYLDSDYLHPLAVPTGNAEEK